MQLSSMTGFSRKEINFDLNTKKYQGYWEIKSVNAKGKDLKIRLPQELNGFDDAVREACNTAFARGTITVTLDLDIEDMNSQIIVNENLLNNLLCKAEDLYARHSDFLQKPSLFELLKMPDVLKVKGDTCDEETQTKLFDMLYLSLEKAIQDLKEDRLKEGRKIGSALLEMIAKMEDIVAKVCKIADETPSKIKDKIKGQIDQILVGSDISPDRLEQEVLLLIMRADVKEELDRLKAHLKTARELLASTEPVGRRLDFLCQELNREANTLCSKSMDLEQTNYGMQLKAIIEQFREQVQNVE